LMIKVNSPNVSMLRGKVRRRITGRKKAFKIPRIAAAKNAEKKPLTRMPSMRYEARMIDAVRTNHLNRMPLIPNSSLVKILSQDACLAISGQGLYHNLYSDPIRIQPRKNGATKGLYKKAAISYKERISDANTPGDETLKNVRFCIGSRRTTILTAGIHFVL